MKKLLLALLVALGATNPLYAHKEWVHQHMVKEAYKFLENSVGPIPLFRNSVNFHGSGDNSNPFNPSYPQIAIGAWREDMEDIVYHYDLGQGGFTPSITHFWKADYGDNYESAPLNIGYTSKAPNAWEKARVYLFSQDHNGAHDITIPFYNGYSYKNYLITYTSLPEFYKGNYFLEATTDLDGSNRVHYYHQPRFDPTFSKPVALNILGRVAHLLGDMSVPAHAHSHLHPCPLSLPDFYENNMGNVYWSNNSRSSCEDDPGGTYRAEQWTAATAAQTGGLIDQIYCEGADMAKMRYLFYTTNQLADFFPSGVTTSQKFDPRGPVPNNQSYESGNRNLWNGTNAYLNARYAALGSPPSDINHQVIANETFNYSIRAVATLFQWFAFNAGIIEDLRNTHIASTSNAYLVCANGASRDMALTIPATTPVTWSISPSTAATGTVINQGSGQIYRVTPTADAYNGEVRVSASYVSNYACSSQNVTIKQDLWKGAPIVSIQTQEESYGNYNSYQDMEPYTTLGIVATTRRADLQGNLVYSWTHDNPNFQLQADGGNAGLGASSQYFDFVRVEVSVASDCGTTTTDRAFATRYRAPDETCIICPKAPTPDPDTPTAAATLEVFPNPSNQSFSVQYVPASRAADAHPAPTTYRLYDTYGRQVREGTLAGPATPISTEALPEGIYILVLKTPASVVRRSIQVRH
ncbi:T9SS type A sorting domain-containing protein [Hymenobacter algoricola]|uniref:T9SS type A sorting domain-containing protein n=1 Tax=Hymenobacter algoricola TaxID=486267 RepID=A0ABP7NCF9_9BACT